MALVILEMDTPIKIPPTTSQPKDGAKRLEEF